MQSPAAGELTLTLTSSSQRETVFPPPQKLTNEQTSDLALAKCRVRASAAVRRLRALT